MEKGSREQIHDDWIITRLKYLRDSVQKKIEKLLTKMSLFANFVQGSCTFSTKTTNKMTYLLDATK